MKVILCADQKNGLLFNRRRQSQDRELRKRILSMIGDGKLYLSAYSAGQFTEEIWADRLVICEDPVTAAVMAEAASAAPAGWLASSDAERPASQHESSAASRPVDQPASQHERCDASRPVDRPASQPAARDAYYFVEGQPLAAAAEAGKLQELILYRWDKVYPADTWLDLALPEQKRETAAGLARPQSSERQPKIQQAAYSWQLTAREDFAGYSHEKITEEKYIISEKQRKGNER